MSVAHLVQRLFLFAVSICFFPLVVQADELNAHLPRISARPAENLISAAVRRLEPEKPRLIRMFGKDALQLDGFQDQKHWLLALQQVTGEYCTFMQVSPPDEESREISSFVGCRIQSAQFRDFDANGRVDVLYKLRVKSNRSSAWVDEEVLFLQAADGKQVCRSATTPNFASSGTKHSCR